MMIESVWKTCIIEDSYMHMVIESVWDVLVEDTYMRIEKCLGDMFIS